MGAAKDSPLFRTEEEGTQELVALVEGATWVEGVSTIINGGAGSSVALTGVISRESTASPLVAGAGGDPIVSSYKSMIWIFASGVRGGVG